MDETKSFCDGMGNVGDHSNRCIPDFDIIDLDLGVAIEEDSDGFDLGRIRFHRDGEAIKGGQATVYPVLREGDESGKYVVKTFFSAEDAKNEWRVLQTHKDDKTVPKPFFIGLAKVSAKAESSSGDETFFAIVMERVEGPTLEMLMQSSGTMGFTVERALRLIKPIVRFCSNSERSRSCHIHRDLKPSNIIIDLSSGENSRLVDFGVSVDANGRGTRGASRGYAAPELIDPYSNGSLNDVRVDTYGIGATLYFALFGHSPAADPNLVNLDRAEGLRHDNEFRGRLIDKVVEDLSTKLGSTAVDRRAAAAVDSALSNMDERIATRIRECMAFEQGKRPTPSMLERVLPLHEEQYEQELFNSAIIIGLNGSEYSSPGPLRYEEELGSDRSFTEALSAFNSGLYEIAVPILRKRALTGDHSAMYYLGLCIRDKLGPIREEEGWADVEHYFSRAAESGNILAQNAYGLMLLQGENVVQNVEKGLQLIKMSAEDDSERGKTGFPLAKKWLVENGYA